jgi:hypothetical protein
VLQRRSKPRPALGRRREWTVQGCLRGGDFLAAGARFDWAANQATTIGPKQIISPMGMAKMLQN